MKRIPYYAKEQERLKKEYFKSSLFAKNISELQDSLQNLHEYSYMFDEWDEDNLSRYDSVVSRLQTIHVFTINPMSSFMWEKIFGKNGNPSEITTVVYQDKLNSYFFNDSTSR